MQAWFIRRYGGAEVLERGELPEPEVGPRDVLVAVRAASVNPIDWKLRDGGLKRILPLAFPIILGNDCAGEVIECGAEVSELAPGDPVFARLPKDRIGAFAKRVAIDRSAVARAPSNIPLEDAAALPLVGLTAYQALCEIAEVAAGDKVLIQAGAGGVGTFAIQLARHFGAEIATTASVDKHDLVRELGADHCIDYRAEDFREILEGYAVVLDGLGKDSIHRAFSILRPGGIVVSLYGVPDPQFARDWGLSPIVRAAIWMMSRSTRRLATRLGVRYRFWFMRADGDQLGTIARLVESGAVRPVIDRTFDFDEVDQAIAYTERGHASGKVIVAV